MVGKVISNRKSTLFSSEIQNCKSHLVQSSDNKQSPSTKIRKYFVSIKQIALNAPNSLDKITKFRTFLKEIDGNNFSFPFSF